ncbi:hypothetical protein HBI12_052740 [Parastagonospora nodorum]|nr:hypothetical protein HBI12_052740 [Parastagonospora nodorum]KAH5433958.1 hypothetical protein HBI47_088880 [Parastagonospora nodorum]
MAREVDQAKLPEYRGKFSWAAATLRAHIEAVMPKYDRFDPKTWPLVTADYLRSFLGHEYDGTQLLPLYVAYERGLVDKCVAHFADKLVNVMQADGQTTTNRGLYFYLFPFVYNSQGQARKFEYMHADHYITWVSDLTGTVPITRTKGRNGKDVPALPPSAFTECLEILKEAHAKADVNNPKKSHQELAKGEKRADTAEKARDGLQTHLEQMELEETRRSEAWRQSNEAVKAKLKDALAEEKQQHEYTKNDREADRRVLQYANTSWDKETTRANAAEESNKLQAKLLISKDAELGATKDQVRDLEKQLEAAKKEAATAQEQINIIRDELKKTRGNQTRKRPAGEGTADASWKRIKNDFEE